MEPPVPTREGRMGAGTTWPGAAVLSLVALVLVVAPGVVVGGMIARGWVADASAMARSAMPAWGLFGGTLAWTGGIAAGATVIALPAGLWLARGDGRRWAFMLVPMVLPSYLTYAAWGLLRAPGSMVGDWIERHAAAGADWLPVAIGRVLAVVGLVLWSWPIAAVVIASGVRRIEGEVLAAMRLDVPGAARRMIAMLSMVRGAVSAAFGLVLLVQLGSAVPLHLAEVPTYAIAIWFDVTQGPASAAPFVRAWPLVVIALVGGWIVGGRALEESGGVGEGAAAGRATRWVVACVWVVSVLVPLALFAVNLRKWASVAVFLRAAAGAIGVSACAGIATGVVFVCVALLTWWGLSGGGNAGRVTRWCVRLFVGVGLLPGVLVGAALLRACEASEATRWLLDADAILVCGHVARYAFVPALVGVWLAKSEPAERTQLRRVDGATGWWGWVWSAAWGQRGVIAAVGVAGFVLSFHEIEASIVLQPPGSGGVAHLILNYLHYARMDEMCAAALVLVGGSLTAVLLAAVLPRGAGAARAGARQGL